ncbi:MAG: type II toxin-antitoxin system Phd/YefM family antitoxin [Acidobacteriota bacterium]|jgi:prevent-host-death family protein|nr:type II toxin-antitoxin system Phd/YefM family antitoxin [Acidobacteriota bacterium]
MPQIRPISDLRNRFTDISRIVHEDKEPVFLTKNGYGDMVVMSIDDYRARKFTHDVDIKLLEARDEAMNTDKRLTHEEVMAHMREIIRNASKKV